MSLIERVADMLEQMPQPDRKSLATHAEPDASEPSVIERAVSNKAWRSDVARNEGVAAVEHELPQPKPAP